MLVSLDSVSQAIVDVIRMNDYAVAVTQEGETYHGVATHPDGRTSALLMVAFGRKPIMARCLRVFLSGMVCNDDGLMLYC